MFYRVNLHRGFRPTSHNKGIRTSVRRVLHARNCKRQRSCNAIIVAYYENFSMLKVNKNHQNILSSNSI